MATVDELVAQAEEAKKLGEEATAIKDSIKKDEPAAAPVEPEPVTAKLDEEVKEASAPKVEDKPVVAEKDSATVDESIKKQAEAAKNQDKDSKVYSFDEFYPNPLNDGRDYRSRLNYFTGHRVDSKGGEILSSITRGVAGKVRKSGQLEDYTEAKMEAYGITDGDLTAILRKSGFGTTRMSEISPPLQTILRDNIVNNIIQEQHKCGVEPKTMTVRGKDFQVTADTIDAGTAFLEEYMQAHPEDTMGKGGITGWKKGLARTAGVFVSAAAGGAAYDQVMQGLNQDIHKRDANGNLTTEKEKSVGRTIFRIGAIIAGDQGIKWLTERKGGKFFGGEEEHKEEALNLKGVKEYGDLLLEARKKGAKMADNPERQAALEKEEKQREAEFAAKEQEEKKKAAEKSSGPAADADKPAAGTGTGGPAAGTSLEGNVDAGIYKEKYLGMIGADHTPASIDRLRAIHAKYSAMSDLTDADKALLAGLNAAIEEKATAIGYNAKKSGPSIESNLAADLADLKSSEAALKTETGGKGADAILAEENATLKAKTEALAKEAEELKNTNKELQSQLEAAKLNFGGSKVDPKDAKVAGEGDKELLTAEQKPLANIVGLINQYDNAASSKEAFALEAKIHEAAKDAGIEKFENMKQLREKAIAGLGAAVNGENKGNVVDINSGNFNKQQAAQNTGLTA